MKDRRYKIAGRIVELRSIHPGVHRLCRDYLTNEPADFAVETTPADIVRERIISLRSNSLDDKAESVLSDSYLEELAVYRKIAEKMPDYGTLLFHASSIAVDGWCYMFMAPSGTGKSTHTRLWREVFGDRALMVNDDKPLVTVGDVVMVHGTPWNGKHRLGSNVSVPLKAICLLERGAANSIAPAPSTKAFSLLLPYMYRPAVPSGLMKSLALLASLASQTRLYRLVCNMERDAATTAFEGMQ